MTKQRLYALSTCAALLGMGSVSTAFAEEIALDGAQLFATKACLSCHGADGRTPILPIYPKIAGQNAGYIYNQLRDIKSGARNSGQAVIMLGIMAGVNDAEMRAIADWLATQ